MPNDTPWRAERHEDPIGGWTIRDANGMLAAIGMTMADAQMAARAVNNHEALVEALKDLRRFASDLPLARNDRFVALNQRVLQALAAAEPQAAAQTAGA